MSKYKIIFYFLAFFHLHSCGKKLSSFEQVNQQWDLSRVEPIFSDSLSEIIYDMTIQYKNNLNSGILAVAFDSSGYYRLVFLNKAGPKLLDLVFTPDNMNVINIIKAFDKKILLNILEKDFRMLFDPMVIQKQKDYIDQSTGNKVVKLDAGQPYYYMISPVSQIIYVHRAKGKRSIVEMKLEYMQKDCPETIEIQHNRIPLSLQLKKL